METCKKTTIKTKQKSNESMIQAKQIKILK
jgi:hypothetical protein